MRRELTKPHWLLLGIVILWGIAGKLDESLEGFDPEPMPRTSTDLGEESAFPPIHLLCYLDEQPGGRNSAGSGVAVLTSFQPAPRGVASDANVAASRLRCVVTDD